MSQTEKTTPAVSEDSPIGAGIPYERFLDCVHCGLCTAACPTYLETGNENDSPRGRIYLMRAVADGRLELNDRVQSHLDLCLDCRSCETACPSGVQYGRLIEPFRVDARHRAPGAQDGSWFERWVIRGVFPYPRRLRWALAPVRVLSALGLERLVRSAGLQRFLPRGLDRLTQQLPRLRSLEPALPPVLPAEGPRRARVGLFTGCVADVMFRNVHWAVARVLQRNGCEVVTPRAQRCCGAIHYHSGADEKLPEMIQTNVNAFPDDLDAILVDVAGCGAQLKEYGHLAEELAGVSEPQQTLWKQWSGRVRDVSEFLSELGPLVPEHPLPCRATYHDACHLAHAQGVRQQPRSLLELVPELELIPLAESDICCGAAGSYNLTQPEMSDRLSLRKVENVKATRPELVITGNAGCALQLESGLRQAGLEIPVVHPFEVLDASYRGTSLKG